MAVAGGEVNQTALAQQINPLAVYLEALDVGTGDLCLRSDLA